MTATTQTATSPAATKPKSAFAIRDFKLLWIGEAVSALGDQFALIALPWLALLLTGDALALGTVLAVMAIPRAVLMIVGGAFVDRLSPRRVMLLSNAVRFVAVGALGLIVIAGAAQLWMLYIFALMFGIADAFFYPAQTAIVPELVEGDQLQQANGITQGTAQFTALIGPVVAGVAIAALGSSSSAASVAGVGVALLIDAVSFIVSIGTLTLIRPREEVAGAAGGSVINQISEGIRFVLRQPALRVVMLISMGANLLIVGPLDVGLPLLAFSRLPEGAAAFGLILAGFGGGSLLGLLAATVLPALPPARFGTVVLLMMGAAGLALAALVFATSTIAAVLIAVFAGAMIGYTNVSFITWVQRRIPQNLMGRVMSLLVFASVSLVPISMAIAGVAVSISLDGVFLLSGVGFALLTLSALLSRSVRRMGLEPTLEEERAAADGTSASQPAVAAAS
jgi:MFS family permease